MPQSTAGSGIRVYWKAAHRDGQCIKCNVPMEVKEIELNGKKVNRPVCPECGGNEGHIIARAVSVQPPDPPTCLSFRCLFKFFRDSLFCALLSNYHRRRVTYAEKNRHKKILARYRSGEPAPTTIWQAIHANTKLRCPVCRRYNIDPFLFRGNNKFIRR